MSKRHSFEVPGLHHENPIPMGCVIGNIMMSSGIFGMEPETRIHPTVLHTRFRECTDRKDSACRCRRISIFS